MSDITEYKPASVVPADKSEVSSKIVEMIRNDRFLDEKTRAHLLKRQSILARIFPTQTDSRVQQFQYDITDICCQFFVEEYREDSNDCLMRLKAALRSDTIIYFRQQQAKVEADLSQTLRTQAIRICQDIDFCNSLPDERVRQNLEEVIRANFRKMLEVYQRTNDYFNESLDTQIKSAR